MSHFFRLILSYRWTTVFLSLLLIGLAGFGIKDIRFSSDYRMFFKADNPQLLAFDALQKTYTKNDNVLFVLTPDDGDVFTARNLAVVEYLTEQSWQTPYSIRVDSISNYQYSHADEDDLIVEYLVENAEALATKRIAKIKEIALNEPLLVNRLISPSGHVTGINITVQLPEKNLTEMPEVANFARDLAEKTMEKYPFMSIRVTGMVMMNNSFPEASQRDIKTLYPLMFLVIIVALWSSLKSLTATIATFLVIILTVIGTMGLTGWSGIVMSPPTTITPIVIMTLAVADCVHILVTFFHHFKLGLSRLDALLESLRVNIFPVFLTSLTTAIGFLSFNFSEAPPFQNLGNMSAMGVLLAFLLSITLMPALMLILPLKTPEHIDDAKSSFMASFADYIIQFKTPIFWLMAMLSVFMISQVPNNELNDEFVKYFDETISFRTDTDYATKNLTGIYQLEYSLESGETGGINDPEYLQHVEDFANWFRHQPRVLHVNTLTDIMKRLNKNMHADDPQWYRLPKHRDLAAQYLLLYEFSLPFGLDLNNQINVKKSASRLTVTFESLSSNEMLAIEGKAQKWLERHVPASMVSKGTSPSIMFAHLGTNNVHSMLKGTSVALVLISMILIFSLGSFKIGLISLIPNLVPAALAFGLWGMLVGQVGLALSVVTGMTLGIVVDDTIHFLSKYLRAKRENNLTTEDAIRYAFKTVGKALWITSLVLAIGFSVLFMSHFELNSGMGLLTAITIVFALLADFFLLPTLLLKIEGRKK